MEEVILVDEHDKQCGTMEKMEAHRKGLLHRAFSIVIYNSKGELLLQKRATGKYHSAGLWSNTCCSHPRPGEEILKAAERRLKEEMGIVCSLTLAGHFIYKAELPAKITEYEYDYVLKGISDESPVLNKNEAADFRYVSIEDFKKEIKSHPGFFTFWLKEMLSREML